jgi:hypothetical protein
MSIEMISSDENTATFQVTFNFNNSMLDSENAIQDKLNEVGTLTLIHMALYFNRSIGSLIGFWD